MVDDQQLVLTLLSKILKSNGYNNISLSKNGFEALKKIRQERINFVITDWNMPRMNGIELLLIIRNDLDYFDMPVFMIGEEMSEDKILYAVEEGVDAYQQKPFSETNIINSINHVLQKELDPTPLKYKIQKMTAMRLRRRLEPAIEYGKTLLKSESDIFDILINLSECFLESREFNQATKCLEQALKIKQAGKVYHMLGKVKMREAEYEEAIIYLQKAKEINPANIVATIDVGHSYLHLGQAKEAAEIFDTISDVSLTDLNNIHIGEAYLNCGNLEKAGNYLHQTRIPILDTVAVFNKYAMELRKLGQFENAVEQYQKCIEIDPTNHIILLNAAVVHSELKQYKEAERLILQCLDIDKNFEDAKKFLEFVRSKK